VDFKILEEILAVDLDRTRVRRRRVGVQHIVNPGVKKSLHQESRFRDVRYSDEGTVTWKGSGHTCIGDRHVSRFLVM
jgi:hypothetical protein